MASFLSFCPLWGVWMPETKLGEGSFGTVWKMRREELGKVYYAAVKHIPVPRDQQEVTGLYEEGAFTDNASAGKYYDGILEQLVGEIDTMYRLKGYSNIVSYEDHLIVPRKNGVGYDVFLRMELLEGLPARAAAGLTAEDVVSLGIDIATAIETLNSHRLIHRDIKPQNIFVNETGNYKLGDYGTARALESNATTMSSRGTYNYMAPEIYHHRRSGWSVDVYSLGIVLYRYLNGNRLPFLSPGAEITRERSEEALARRIAGNQPLPPPAYADERLAAIVLKACAYDPADRYPNGAALKQALMEYRMGLSPSAVPAREPAEPAPAPEPSVSGGTPYRPMPNEGSVSGGTPYRPMPNEGSVSGGASWRPAPYQTPPSTGMQAPVREPAYPVQPGPSEQPRKNGKNRTISVIAIIAVVVIAAVGIVIGNSRNKDGPEADGLALLVPDVPAAEGAMPEIPEGDAPEAEAAEDPSPTDAPATAVPAPTDAPATAVPPTEEPATRTEAPAPTATPLPAPTEDESSAYPAFTATKKVNVRADANADSRRITQLAKTGTQVTVLSTTRDRKGVEWSRVRLQNGDVGYIQSEYLSTHQRTTFSIVEPFSRGDFKTLSVSFLSDQDFDAYSGPGEKFRRGAKGRAYMSTNDPICVYGREGEWILVQYCTSDIEWRFAYVSVTAAEEGYGVKELPFQARKAVVTTKQTMTDDPLHSRRELLQVKKGAEVIYLGDLDSSWAYIEYDRARGFVPMNAVAFDEE